MTSSVLDLHREIEIFLYREAKLLDEGRFEEWLDLFTEDARYWLPITETRDAGQERGPVKGEWAVVEDDKRFLAKRYERLTTTLAHAEQPRSRTRRFITNVLVSAPSDDAVTAESNLLVFQARRDKSEQFFVGRRQDEIVRAGDGWKISSRTIVFDHRILPRALSIFF